MENSHSIVLNFGYRESEDGISHAFIAEDASENEDIGNMAYELSSLLGTIPEDDAFNWDTAQIIIPEKTAKALRLDGMRIAAEATRQPRKSYTLEQFRAITNKRRITASGWLTADAIAKCLNYSSILTRLIKTAGRLVDCYASDLFILWRMVAAELDHVCGNAMSPETEMAAFSKSYLFGFREMGVDDTKTILTWYNDNQGNQGQFREIWRLDIEINELGDIRAELYEVNKTI